MSHDLAPLISRAIDGDEVAFGDLFRRTVHQVHRIVLSRIRNPEVVDDVVQEAYLKAFTNLPQLRDPDSFVSWVASIALNHFRSRAAEREQTIPFSAVADISYPEPPSEERTTRPDEMVTIRELQLAVAETIDQMPNVLQDAFTLRFLGDCSYREIAEILEIPRGTAKSRVYRATRYFEELWDETLDPPPAREGSEPS